MIRRETVVVNYVYFPDINGKYFTYFTRSVRRFRAWTSGYIRNVIGSYIRRNDRGDKVSTPRLRSIIHYPSSHPGPSDQRLDTRTGVVTE